MIRSWVLKHLQESLTAIANDDAIFEKPQSPEQKNINHFFSSKMNRAIIGDMLGGSIGAGADYLLGSSAIIAAINPILIITIFAIICAGLFVRYFDNFPKNTIPLPTL
jgi:hypothetical protein